MIAEFARAVAYGLGVFALVFVAGSLINGALWDRVLPENVNDWAVLGWAGFLALLVATDELFGWVGE